MLLSRASALASVCDSAAAFCDRLGHRALEDRDEQIVLAPEIEIDGSGREAGGAGDIRDLCIEKAAGGECVDGGAQQRIPLVATVGFGSEPAGQDRHMNECSFIAANLSSRRFYGIIPQRIRFGRLDEAQQLAIVGV